ncbi:hypothetical protein OR62_05485 [Clostridium tetani]|uniref:Uncharacterized protein n=1 Tax=Clostridium tetani TaxID=1513 RepID=A0ABY0EPY5_CLOTA|nr:DUF5986 family protein [Clostridium tetani]YP_009219396.1 DUF5986 family protein [Clostridium phage phiCT9441A]AJA42643.1 hypothetical protein phiCT9441A_31 [Clostridium phage phiCT9441A]KGI40321.1 hypothetical protein LA33_06620 [Clostridium tetani ATCC 9441]KHO39502.1 hypothetical protein OR62_05485 [Clostridium tetani]RXI52657.1 hypothetical protein DP131_12120 [Clostridium tetani]RXI68579.1 hypothetical protein DQN76_09985 [Clostridium tetani]
MEKIIKSTVPENFLEPENIRKLIKNLNDSREEQNYDLNEKNHPTTNGRYHDRWNYIFKNIEQSFRDKPFKCYRISRGPLWQLVAIYRTDYDLLYILLKKDRFLEIKKDSKNKSHYSKILNLPNNNLKMETYKQTSFIPNLQLSNTEYIFEEFKKMIPDIKDKIKGCINILFTENKERLTEILAVIANCDLNIIESCNWSKYISVGVEEIIDTKSEFEENTPLIPLKIKERVNDKTNDTELVKNKKTKKNIKKE